MTNNSKATTSQTVYDLEERTFLFARNCREYIKCLPKTITVTEDSKQLVRSSGSVGANYIEANEALSKKDFVMRVKIARKEAKESRFWLRLLESSDAAYTKNRTILFNEATELVKILSAILEKSK